MPMHGYLDNSAKRRAARKEAERQVRAKFPNLIEGSSGWWRAVQNRFNRLY